MIRAALMLVVTVVAVAGCATLGERGDDVTGGRTVEMYVVEDGSRFARYLVDRDGSLSFAGGRDAQASKYTWTGPLTEEELDRLFALIDEHEWAERDPASVADPGPTYTIRFRGPRIRRNFTVVGDSPDVRPVAELLAEASKRRNEEFLRELPESGMQRRQP
jgi:hypothetical protein